MPASSPADPIPPATALTKKGVPERIAKMFRRRWTFFYVRSKLRTDPVYRAMASRLLSTQLPVLDLGCGMGLFSFFLREHGFTAPIHGVDYDERKIRTARRLAAKHCPELKFDVADVRSGVPEHSGSVAILDILQYLKPPERIQTLEQAAARVAPGGYFLIRGCVRDESWRFRLTRFTDAFAQGIRWIKPGSLDYPTRDEIATTLEAAGLRGASEPLWGGTPFNNYFFIFRRE